MEFISAGNKTNRPLLGETSFGLGAPQARRLSSVVDDSDEGSCQRAEEACRWVMNNDVPGYPVAKGENRRALLPYFVIARWACVGCRWAVME